jgi:hypothetical protein
MHITPAKNDGYVVMCFEHKDVMGNYSTRTQDMACFDGHEVTVITNVKEQDIAAIRTLPFKSHASQPQASVFTLQEVSTFRTCGNDYMRFITVTYKAQGGNKTINLYGKSAPVRRLENILRAFMEPDCTTSDCWRLRMPLDLADFFLLGIVPLIGIWLCACAAINLDFKLNWHWSATVISFVAVALIAAVLILNDLPRLSAIPTVLACGLGGILLGKTGVLILAIILTLICFIVACKCRFWLFEKGTECHKCT